MPGAEWFPGATCNYAEHIFRGKDDGAVAIRHASELRDAGRVDLGRAARARPRGSPRACARSASSEGDRVCAYLPNIPETIAAFLASASMGAIWSSAAPEFGARSVVDRFQQIEPKVLLAIDGYRYGGKDFDRREIVDGIAGRDRRAGRAASATSTAAAGRRASCRTATSTSTRCRSTTRSGCSTAPARPACRRRSSTARAGSCSSTSRRCTCTSTRTRATASSGSRRPAG